MAEPICRSLKVSSRITAKLRDLLKLHDSLPKSKNVTVVVAAVAAVPVLAAAVVVEFAGIGVVAVLGEGDVATAAAAVASASAATSKLSLTESNSIIKHTSSLSAAKVAGDSPASSCGSASKRQ